MNQQQLLAHFDRVSDAPDAIPRLRRFILDLAVRGKLVEQDQKDEAAEELLRRIKTERKKLHELGLNKKWSTIEEVNSDESPFELPPTWKWTRLIDISVYIQRGKSPTYASQGYPVISQRCVQWSGLDLSVAKFVSSESLGNYDPQRFLKDNDLLWNSTGTGTIGRIVRVIKPPEKLICDGHVTVVRCLSINPEYVRTWLRSDNVYGLIESRATGATNQVELTSQMALNQVVPLPPLAEQHRIVAKVDELMALCDQLESAQNEREEHRDNLLSASLIHLYEPVEDKPMFQSYSRFFLNTLPRLTTRYEHIKQMRQTILNLAVRGKLFSNIETKTELLKNVVELISGQHLLAHEHNTVGKGIPYLTGPSDFGEEHPAPTRWTQTPKVVAEPGDILITVKGSGVGKTNKLVAEKTAISRQLMAIRVRNEDPDFIHLILKNAAKYFQASMTGTAIPGIGREDVLSLKFEKPSLADQRRIVAKVDELMKLCDQLEKNIKDERVSTYKLLEALLHQSLKAA